jgi:hypothetical protein
MIDENMTSLDKLKEGMNIVREAFSDILKEYNQAIKKEVSADTEKDILHYSKRFLLVTNNPNDFISIEDLRAYYKMEFGTVQGFPVFRKDLSEYYGLDSDIKNIKGDDGYKSSRVITGIKDNFHG